MTQGQLDSTQDHSVQLLGLIPGATYHWRAMWRDEDGNIGYSQDMILRTQDAPGISEVNIVDIKLHSAIITWKTTTISTSKILYGKSTAYGLTAEDKSSSQVTTHTVQLNDLDDTSAYHFKITGADADGNVLSSDDYAFNTLTFPRIFNVRLEQQKNMPTATVKATWESNVPTSSVFQYFEGDSSVAKEVAKSPLETKHTLNVTNLKDNANYRITVKGRDAYGNETESEMFKLKTDIDSRPPEVFDITSEPSVIGIGVDAKGQLIISWNTDEPATSQVEYGIGVAGDTYAMKTQEDAAIATTHVVVISDLKPSTSYHFRIISKDASSNKTESPDNSVLTGQSQRSVIDLVIKSLENSVGWLFGMFGSSS
jgi:hypothetical protein